MEESKNVIIVEGPGKSDAELFEKAASMQKDNPDAKIVILRQEHPIGVGTVPTGLKAGIPIPKDPIVNWCSLPETRRDRRRNKRRIQNV